MKFTTTVLAICWVWFFSAAAFAEAPAAAAAAQPAAEKFALTVKFQTPITTAEIKSTITLGESFFEKVDEPKGGFTSISGTVLPAADGSYTLYLTSIEWASSHSSSMGAGKSVIKLDEPQTGGMVSSFLYSHTITLTRAKAAAK